MSIAKILVPLTGSPRDETALATAFVAAKPHAAHVVALYVRQNSRFAAPYWGATLMNVPMNAPSPRVMQSLIDSTDEMNCEAARAASTALANAAAAAGVAILPAPRETQAVTCSLRETEGVYSHCVADAAQLSDLVVFGSVSAADGADLADAFVETLLKTERPVLLAARAPASLSGKMVFAWDGSAAAARALVGATPILKHAAKITLLSCRQRDATETRFADAKEYLALHGLSAAEEVIAPGTQSVGEALLDAAVKSGADLLAMGGYGHSHLGETFFGGVTQYVRRHASLPVLMIH